MFSNAPAAAPLAASSAPAKPGSTSSPPGARGTILVVDDSQVIRSAVTKTLQARGHTVHQAENGRLGVETWEQHKAEIQLVISDVFMPELDGFSMAKEIRRRSRTVPILLMSSKLDENSRWVADEAGFRLLPKPFRDEVLLMLVDRLLRTAPPSA